MRNWPFESRSGTLFWTLSSLSGGQNSSESSVFVAAWSHFVVVGAWHFGFVLLVLSRKWPRRLGETHFSGLAGCALDSVLKLSMEGYFGASRLKNSQSPSCRPRSHKIATRTSHLPSRTRHLPPRHTQRVPNLTPKRHRNNPNGHNHPTKQPVKDQGLQFNKSLDFGRFARGVLPVRLTLHPS